MKNKPIIGVTPWYNYDNEMAYIKKGYFEGLLEAGGRPVLLPIITDHKSITEYVDMCDGILISGGPDVDALVYGEENLLCNGEISPYRDVMEIAIIREVISKNKPVFGICRGIQIMNVAMGGTLYQDVHAQIKDGMVIKHSQQAPRWYPTHEVILEKNSKVWKAFGSDVVKVNSFHHQAVKDVAKGFEVTARAKDGVIEAIEYIRHKFAVGIQWHQELMWEKEHLYLGLFRDFIESCKVE